MAAVEENPAVSTEQPAVGPRWRLSAWAGEVAPVEKSSSAPVK